MIRFGALPKTTPLSLGVHVGQSRRSFATHKTVVPLIINGRDVEAPSSFPATSPLTGERTWSYSCATKQHVEDAIQSAHDAFPAWSRTKASHRRDILLRAADVMNARREELGNYMHHEIGAGQDYQNFILGLAIEGFKDTAGRIAGVVSGSVPESNLEGMKAMVCKKPYGVNVGIAPW
ncbi:hypothetical protein QQX98_010798 [Neonectria punicea]|uniref:Aldehyde dehydrogenase domain-containing protein n=1 Tax=Neonectria punicea TaxID=979145 RepID=A0ABR1GNH1_9HYPO